MARPAPTLDPHDRDATLGQRAWPWYRNAAILGVVALVIALAWALIFSDNGLQRFSYAYLVGFCFVLTITLGSLFFVVITHLFKAGWCAAIRRIPELIAGNLLTLAVMALPLVLLVWTHTGSPYIWAQSEEDIAAIGYHGDGHYGDDHHGDEAHDGDHDPGDAPFANFSQTRGDGPTPVGDDTFNDEPAPAATPEPGPDDVNHSGPLVVRGDEADPTIVHTDPPHHDELDPHDDPDLAYADDHNSYEATANDIADPDGDGFVSSADYASLVGYMIPKKQPWLTPWFWTIRVILYFAILVALGWWYLRSSKKQDVDGQPGHTLRREAFSPFATIGFALALTFLSFDLVMSLDPAWYSTMFGVYFFAGSFLSSLCVLALAVMGLQRLGYVRSATIEHLHDVGKLMFAFTFFWGYIAFSQYMLIWYASFPETAYWFQIRGATTVTGLAETGSAWSWVILILLFGHLLVPFAFLLSRHVKRNRTLLAIAAVWLLVMHYLDLLWIIMPQHASPHLALSVPEIGCVVGLTALAFAGVVRLARDTPLVAIADPRMHESLALDTTAAAPLYPNPDTPADAHKPAPGTTDLHPTPA
jgi:hypothetical protein